MNSSSTYFNNKDDAETICDRRRWNAHMNAEFTYVVVRTIGADRAKGKYAIRRVKRTGEALRLARAAVEQTLQWRKAAKQVDAAYAEMHKCSRRLDQIRRSLDRADNAIRV